MRNFQNIIILLLVNICYTQELKNLTFVEYSITPNIKTDSITNEKKLDEKYTKIISFKDQIKFKLIFNNEKSVFDIIELMDEKDNMNYKLATILYGGNYKYFKNILNKKKNYEVDYLGQLFNVEVDYEQYKWEISHETKEINGFLCYKATTTFEKIDKALNTAKTYHPIAWFTPEIPSSFGPNGIDGLPGLVLEATLDGNKFYYATKILLNYNDSQNIFNEKNNSKKITEDQFQDINAKMYKQIKSD
jgi:GLPGLI family protein